MSVVERALAKAAALRGKSNGAPRQQRSMSGKSSAVPVANNSGAGVEVDSTALRALGLIPTADMEHRIHEELRLIKRPLLQNAEEGRSTTSGNLIMVASALPGAGKTFLSLNLAISMASELDWNVLLIDADMGRATLSRALGLRDAPGLAGLLDQERASLNDFVFKTSLPRLHVLPAGGTRPQFIEVLGSQLMRNFVSSLGDSSQRLIVLFDSPPLLLTSEARVLASHVGQVVLVVEAGVTPRRSVLAALEVLDPSKAINLVLNKNRQIMAFGDEYGGYEPYGYGHQPEQRIEK